MPLGRSGSAPARPGSVSDVRCARDLADTARVSACHAAQVFADEDRRARWPPPAHGDIERERGAGRQAQARDDQIDRAKVMSSARCTSTDSQPRHAAGSCSPIRTADQRGWCGPDGARTMDLPRPGARLSRRPVNRGSPDWDAEQTHCTGGSGAGAGRHSWRRAARAARRREPDTRTGASSRLDHVAPSSAEIGLVTVRTCREVLRSRAENSDSIVSNTDLRILDQVHLVDGHDQVAHAGQTAIVACRRVWSMLPLRASTSSAVRHRRSKPRGPCCACAERGPDCRR